MWYGRGKLPLVKKLSQRGDVIEIELYSSQEALKILAQLYGMLKEWVEHTGQVAAVQIYLPETGRGATDANG